MIDWKELENIQIMVGVTKMPIELHIMQSIEYTSNMLVFRPHSSILFLKLQMNTNDNLDVLLENSLWDSIHVPQVILEH